MCAHADSIAFHTTEASGYRIIPSSSSRNVLKTLAQIYVLPRHPSNLTWDKLQPRQKHEIIIYRREEKKNEIGRVIAHRELLNRVGCVSSADFVPPFAEGTLALHDKQCAWGTSIAKISIYLRWTSATAAHSTEGNTQSSTTTAMSTNPPVSSPFTPSGFGVVDATLVTASAQVV